MSAMAALASEERYPGGEGERQREYSKHKTAGTYPGLQTAGYQHTPAHQRQCDADQDAEHPRRKEGAEHVDRWHALTAAKRNACRHEVEAPEDSASDADHVLRSEERRVGKAGKLGQWRADYETEY